MFLPAALKDRLANNSLIKRLFRYSESASKNTLSLLALRDLVDLQERASSLPWSRTDTRDTAHRLAGDMRSVYLGSGLDYEESRPYVAGDDVRFMNWRLTARTGESYMKVFREEKRPATFIMLDKRAPMLFGTKKRIKLTQAIRVTGYIAFSSLINHRGIAAVVLNDKLEWLETCFDEGAVCHFLNTVSTSCKPGYEVENASISINHAIRMMQKMMIPGSDVCLVSDFADLSDESRGALLQLSLECNLTAFHIIDDAEIDLPDTGEIWVKTTKSKNYRHLDTGSEDIKRHFSIISSARINKIRKLFNSLGVDYIQVNTADEAIEQLAMKQ